MIRPRSIAWLALWAMLFSAASPTLAALVLTGKPALLGQMLGLPPGSSGAADAYDHASHVDHDRGHSESAGDTDHGVIGHSESTGDPQHDGSHQSHGVYCSLCLNPSSLATVAPLPPALWLLGLEFDLARPEPHPAPFAAFLPLYRSRAPPAGS
jgi:hypothetical protein